MFVGLVDVDVSRLYRAVAEYASHLVERHCFRRELRQPPGGARLGVGRRIGAGWEGDGDVVRGRLSLADIGDGGDDVGELVRLFEIDREEAVVPGGAAQWLTLPGSPAAHTGTPGR